MARLFFAVGVAREVVPALDVLCSTLKTSAGAECFRFVELGQGHYTLCFLGETSAERQTAAVRVGLAAAAGTQSFELAAESIGVFPDEQRPHTLWMGAGEGRARLVGLAARLYDQLAGDGFLLEKRPFVPHLTLARVKRRPPAHAMRALLATPRAPIGPWRVDRFALMESTRTKSGVRYVSVETFSLES